MGGGRQIGSGVRWEMNGPLVGLGKESWAASEGRGWVGMWSTFNKKTGQIIHIHIGVY